MKNKSVKLKCFAAITEKTCPVISYYYYSNYKLENLHERKENGSKVKSPEDLFSRCAFCCSKFSGDNYSVRISPKPAFNKKIKRLLERYDEHSSHFGKYQTKLLTDYKHGRNTLTVTCHTCKKKSKFAGLSREQKLKNDLCHREKLNLHAEPQVRSKKEKKKEKKKLLRQRKAAGITEVDTTAGLNLPKDKESSLHTGNTTNSSNPSSIEAVQEDVGIKLSGNSEQSKSSHITGTAGHSKQSKSSRITGTAKEKNKSNRLVSQEFLLKNNSASLQPQNKQVNKQSDILIGQKSDLDILSVVQKKANKKQKSKMLGKQLGNILKQEQKKKSEGSLADFLSSI